MTDTQKALRGAAIFGAIYAGVIIGPCYLATRPDPFAEARAACLSKGFDDGRLGKDGEVVCIGDQTKSVVPLSNVDDFGGY